MGSEHTGKLIAFNMMIGDGFFEGPNQDIDWHNVDEQSNQFAIDNVGTADMLLFGRLTYEGHGELLADTRRH